MRNKLNEARSLKFLEEKKKVYFCVQIEHLNEHHNCLPSKGDHVVVETLISVLMG